MMRAAISLGRLKKNRSSLPAFASPCHAPRIATPSSACHSTIHLPSARIAGQDLLFELGPDAAIQLVKSRVGANVDQVARTRQIHCVAVHDVARRARR